MKMRRPSRCASSFTFRRRLRAGVLDRPGCAITGQHVDFSLLIVGEYRKFDLADEFALELMHPLHLRPIELSVFLHSTQRLLGG